MSKTFTLSHQFQPGPEYTIAFFIFLALGVSFICSLLEAIILSVTWSHIELLSKDEINSSGSYGFVFDFCG